MVLGWERWSLQPTLDRLVNMVSGVRGQASGLGALVAAVRASRRLPLPRPWPQRQPCLPLCPPPPAPVSALAAANPEPCAASCAPAEPLAAACEPGGACTEAPCRAASSESAEEAAGTCSDAEELGGMPYCLYASVGYALARDGVAALLRNVLPPPPPLPLPPPRGSALAGACSGGGGGDSGSWGHCAVRGSVAEGACSEARDEEQAVAWQAAANGLAALGYVHGAGGGAGAAGAGSCGAVLGLEGAQPVAAEAGDGQLQNRRGKRARGLGACSEHVTKRRRRKRLPR